MEMFSTQLKEREHLELYQKGYLKIKFEIPFSQLQQLDSTYVEGREVIFNFNGEAIRTIITSVDVSEDSTHETVKVFLGFAKK